jgi:hypothetical protein
VGSERFERTALKGAWSVLGRGGGGNPFLLFDKIILTLKVPLFISPITLHRKVLKIFV